MINIYTDGGCSGNPGPGGWAYLLMTNEDEPVKDPVLLAENWGAEPSTTNNRMELMAVIESLKALKSLQAIQAMPNLLSRQVAIFTDSQYVQKGISVWIKDWKNRGWKTSDKKPVKNQDIWLCLDELTSEVSKCGFSIAWIWVKGHAGNEFNERCDALTQKAIASL